MVIGKRLEEVMPKAGLEYTDSISAKLKDVTGRGIETAMQLSTSFAVHGKGCTGVKDLQLYEALEEHNLMR